MTVSLKSSHAVVLSCLGVQGYNTVGSTVNPFLRLTSNYVRREITVFKTKPARVSLENVLVIC